MDRKMRQIDTYTDKQVYYIRDIYRYTFYIILDAELSHSVMSMDCSPPGSSVHGDSPDKNTGVGCYALLQGIFPTQGLNPGLLHCRQLLHCLNHQVNPWIMEWVAYPFYRGSSQPRNWTGVSCIAGGFFTNWTTRDALDNLIILFNLLFSLFWASLAP